MKPDWKPEVLPLGLRLQAAGAVLAHAHRQPLGWVAPALELLRKIRELPTAEASRFARVEATAIRPADTLERPAQFAQQSESDSFFLPVQIREQLAPYAPYASDGARQMRVHDDLAAHNIAQQYRAEAVTFGTDVFFGRGKYQPHDREGLALLAHEVVHVGHSLDANVGWQRSGGGAAREEAAAHAAERAVMHAEPVVAASALTAPVHPVTLAPQSSLPAAQQPMRAAEDRPAPTPASSSPAVDMDALRRSLLREVLQQIRTDAERGA